jgi:Na+/H+ antiporter NhaD/arsenite permease-like protein
MITARAIITLVVFIVSTVFVIVPVSVRVPLRHGRHFSIPMNLVPAPILAIALLAAAQCINGSVIQDGIIGTDGIKPYNILILFFSLAYMAISLDITGILEAAAYWVTSKGGKDGRRLYLYFYAMITLISIIFGNDPVILSGTVFLVYFTTAIQVDNHAWLISEFAAANTASMVLFVGNPTNVVICEGFGINNAVFSAYTILPFLACSISCYFVLRFQFQSHIPKVLTDLDRVVRAIDALQDPVGAVVGGVLLGGCLVTVLVASFFGVDVWIITLPFAVAKLLFDLSWDFWRFWYRKHHINPPMQIQMGTINVPSPEREDTPGEPVRAFRLCITLILISMQITSHNSLLRSLRWQN